MKKSSPLPSPNSTRPTSVSNPHIHAPPTVHNPIHIASLTDLALRPRLRRDSAKKSPNDGTPSSTQPESEYALTRDHQHEIMGSNINTTSESTEEGDTDESEENGSPNQKDYEEGMSPEQIQIEKLKQALNEKIAANQRRAAANLSPKPSSTSRPSGGHVGARRVSPIREEESTMSPSLNAAFSSPLASSGLETASTESTESARTIRGSVPPTPTTHLPLRTPSYPFPYVPGTPRTWSSSFHQPFTSLSPTVSGMNYKDSAYIREQIASGESTPAGSASTFLPGDRSLDDPRYPSPSLYDTVLQLNSEPGLDAWWTNVVNICQEWFGAERASLSVPVDASDQNVPWAQQASFDWSGRPDSLPPSQSSGILSDQREEREGEVDDDVFGHLPSAANKRRPVLEARHSYAGHERQRRDMIADTNKSAPRPERPSPPLRTASHAPRTAPLARGDHPLRHMSPASYDGSQPEMHTSFSDPDFSSIGLPDRPVICLHYPHGKALNFEPDPLIDNAGVNRVLERGRLVTLTRDYSVSSSSDTSPDRTKKQQPHPATRPSSSQENHRQGEVKNRNKNTPRFPRNEHHESRRPVSYEEYEQLPTSPWAQSPAPSPAIQNDPNENPFFGVKGRANEDSFDPSDSSGDYSKMQAVEAIGVDKASTVTHIPLVHPLLSQVVRHYEPTSSTPGRHQSQAPRGTRSQEPPGSGDEKKTPIAILSILSSAVPFPQNWTHSLRLLAPHLATSYSIAVQFTAALNQAQNLRAIRFGGAFAQAPMLPEAASLSSLLQMDAESYPGVEPDPGIMTSPSDYSGRSRPSPGSASMAGTPGWDTSMMNIVGRHSVTNTPAHLPQMDTIDSYFDAKKKIMGGKVSHAGSSQSLGPPKSPMLDRGAPRKANIPSPSPINEDDTPTPRDVPKSGQSRDDPAAYKTSKENELSTATRKLGNRVPSFRSEKKQHTKLHSYGADFSSSFQALPTATTPNLRTPGPRHSRNTSVSDPDDFIKQPTSSLLRTITDSLPVQIYTADPTTGVITWVNSKFLVYRGQSPKEALDDPWMAMHPDDREMYMEAWKRCLITGNQLAMKVRLQRFDQTYRWFFVRATPLRDQRQNIVHWIGTNMDFHEQHLAEMNSARQQEVAASEAKYRALANSSPQIVFAATRTKGVIFCNSQWVLYSGQTEADAIGLGFMDHVHPEDIAKCRLPTFDAEGSAIIDAPLTVPPEDVRSPNASEQDMPGEAERFMSPGNAVSPSATGIPQARLSRLASKGILKFSKDIDGRPSYSTEVRLRSKDETYRWHLVRLLLAEPVFRDGSEEETWYGTCTDINDHKLLEQTLKETMDAKSRFLSNMSHEIRTPLNGITGMVNFLIDSNLTAEQMEHVNIIRSSTEGLRDLINDILDLSKVEAGMITLTPQWFAVRDLIEDVNDLTSGMAVDKGLQLNYVLETDVPDELKGDRFRLRQVLLNVIGNAIKFTDVGEVFVHCRVAPESALLPKEEEVMLQFQVIDTGKGFTEKEAEFLFKRFSQIDGSSTRQHGGTGLGLAISMQLVELHGGKMKASSTPGKGSNFTFTVKFQLPSEDDHPVPATGTPGFSTPSYSLPTPFSTDGPPAIEKKFFAATISPGSQMVESPMSHLSERSQPSSASSDPSIHTNDSVRSQRSSASSFTTDKTPLKNMSLSLPGATKSRHNSDIKPAINSPGLSAAALQALPPPMYSILVVCPLEYSRQATVKHLESTLPNSIPHQITARENLSECKELLGGDDPVHFTHVMLVLNTAEENVQFMDQVLQSKTHGATTVVVVSDLAQKRDIMNRAPKYNYEKLKAESRLMFVFKPLKPSKIAAIFDPKKERGMMTDRSHDNAQQVAVSQKQVFVELKRRLGSRGHRVLLVEDNKINQTVILKFLGKIDLEVETVLDGVQCTEKVFSQDHGHYSIILCDLHMPNKDGYQTCREIRRWEKRNKYPYLPIIALSANVLGDVYAKCVEAGFNSYVTKPVDFKVLSEVMTRFLDPDVKGRPHEFMRLRKGH